MITWGEGNCAIESCKKRLGCVRESRRLPHAETGDCCLPETTDLDLGGGLAVILSEWAEPERGVLMRRKNVALVCLSTVCLSVFCAPIESFGEVAREVTYQTHGLNFSPYIDDDENPNGGGVQITDAELQERMELIAPYTVWIRTFGCNEDLEEAGMFAHAMGLNGPIGARLSQGSVEDVGQTECLIDQTKAVQVDITRSLNAAVGAWLGRDLAENARQIECLIDQARAGHVDIAIVGSEVLLRGDLPDTTLIHYINAVRDSLQSTGVDIPVTYADVCGVLLDHPNVVSAVDLVFVNYYPYWEGRKIDYAVAHLHRQHQAMVDIAGGKEVIVSETGWPTCGDQIGEAVPSPENATFYFLNFVSWARANNVKYFYFEAYDEPWKAQYEGPQGACWGIWDREGSLKPGMKAVFDGETIDDNWTNPIPDAPIIGFPSLPDTIETNIPTFPVAWYADAGNTVLLNGTEVPVEAFDSAGNFAVAASLLPGENRLELVIKAGEDTVAAAGKTVTFDENVSTGDKRLIYVDSVLGEDGEEDGPALPGTIVIDLDGSGLLGLIEDKHVVGVSPDGSEIYMSDRAVMSTDSHQQLRTLAFTQDMPANGFLVSPDGSRLYSRNQRLDVATNTLLENLPLDITTGSQWCSAPVPGGPAISSSGRYIYCRNSVSVIDTEENTAAGTGISGHYMSDIALSPDGSKILVSEYSYASGRLDVYSASTFEPLATISGLGDFAGAIASSEDGQRVIIGSAGNPAYADGNMTVVDLEGLEETSQVPIPLGANLATSGYDEFFVSSGEGGLFRRLGVDVFVLGPAGDVVRAKTFFLGINRFRTSSCRPKNNQIRRLVYKAAEPSRGVAPGEQGVDAWIRAYPNPFTQETAIVYQTAARGNVRISVYDVSGRLVKSVADGVEAAGVGSAKWDGKDQQGTPVAAGVYFVRLETPGEVAATKIVLLK